MPTLPRYDRKRIHGPLNAPKSNVNYSSAAFGGRDAQIALLNAENQYRVTSKALKDERDAAITEAGYIGQMGQGMEQLGDNFMSIYMRKKAEEEQAWVAEQTSQFLDWSNEKSLNPETGYTQRLGKNAIGVVGAAKGDYEKRIEAMIANAPSEAAASALKLKLMDLKSRDMAQLARHEATERNKYTAAAVQGEVAAQTRWVSNRWPTMGAEELQAEFDSRVIPLVKEHAARLGLPAEEAIMEAQDAFHDDIIKQVVATGNLDRAMKLVQEWGDELSPSRKAVYFNAIRAEQKSRASEARAAAKAAQTQARENVALSFATQLQEAAPNAGILEKIAIVKDTFKDDPKMVKAITSELKFQHDLHEEQKKKDIETGKARFVEMVNTTKLPGSQVLLRENPVALSQMIQEFKASQDLTDPVNREVIEYADKFLEQVKQNRGLQKNTDPTSFYDLQKKIDTGAVKSAAEVQSLGLIGGVEQADVDELIKHLEGRQSYDSKMVENRYREANGLVGKSLKDKQKAELYNLQKSFGQLIKERQIGGNPENERKLLDNLIVYQEGGAPIAKEENRIEFTIPWRSDWYKAFPGYEPASGYSLQAVVENGETRAIIDDESVLWEKEQQNEEIKALLNANPEVKQRLVDHYGTEERARRGVIFNQFLLGAVEEGLVGDVRDVEVQKKLLPFSELIKGLNLEPKKAAE